MDAMVGVYSYWREKRIFSTRRAEILVENYE
jgi:hypothetical protein